MEYRELFKEIKDPLKDSSTLDRILDAYTRNGNFYHYLTHTGTMKESKKCNTFYKDQLQLTLFNAWKNSLIKLYKSGDINPNYIAKVKTLVKYIIDKNPRNSREVYEIVNGFNVKDSLLIEALEELSWTSVGFPSEFNHIDSMAVYVGKDARRQKIEHRLYINSDSTYTHLIALLFIKKCEEKNLTYYFKYNDVGERDDSFVIYCDTKHLPIYVSILEEIRKENSLDKHLHRPPMLTGNINNWIGYGSEPLDVNGKQFSFNSKRELHLEKCIKDVTTSYITSNLYNNVRTSKGYVQYFNKFIDDFYECVKDRKLHFLSDDDSDNMKRYGFTKKDVYSQEFKICIYNEVKKHFKEIMEYYKGKRDNVTFNAEFRGKSVFIGYGDLDEALKKQVNFFRNMPSYKTDLLNKLRSTSNDYGICSNNYAFAEYAFNLLFNKVYAEDRLKKKNPEYYNFVDKSNKKKTSENNVVNSSSNNSASTIKTTSTPKVKTKYIQYKPMSDREIIEARKNLGL